MIMTNTDEDNFKKLLAAINGFLGSYFPINEAHAYENFKPEFAFGSGAATISIPFDYPKCKAAVKQKKFGETSYPYLKQDVSYS